ncbi:MAG: epimerase [Saprospiraceae bacterium]|nr:MAG: epimerase [Saprospiraceae bacterium]
MANILIAGGSGLVGQRLSELLTIKGYQVSWLSRNKNKDNPYATFEWGIQKGFIEAAAIEWADYVVNLAGAGIADQHWTKNRKQHIIASRVESAALLLEYFKKIKEPKAYLSASAIGYYGNRGDQLLSEQASPGTGFLSKSCMAWEGAIDKVRETGIRTATIRIGIVLSSQGGALEKMLIPFRFFIGTYFGDGAQWYSWIHIDDLCRVFIRGIENEAMIDTYNAVAPHPETNKKLIKSIGQALQKSAIYQSTPAFVLRMGMGEMSHVVLDSAKASSAKIEAIGFKFEFPHLLPALKDLFDREI